MMKKSYATPTVEKIQFQYRDQVVVASSRCISVWINQGGSACVMGDPVRVEFLD